MRCQCLVVQMNLEAVIFLIDVLGIFQGSNPAVLSVACFCRNDLVTVTCIPQASALRLLQPLSQMSGQAPSPGP